MLGRLCEAEVGGEPFENLSHYHTVQQRKSRLSIATVATAAS